MYVKTYHIVTYMTYYCQGHVLLNQQNQQLKETKDVAQDLYMKEEGGNDDDHHLSPPTLLP
jgi:hypothetical protein